LYRADLSDENPSWVRETPKCALSPDGVEGNCYYQAALAAAETQLTDCQLAGGVAEERLHHVAEQLARSQAVASEVHELREAMRDTKEEHEAAVEEAALARRAAASQVWETGSD
jgi:outer membrane murein-binding lipoprotein Lpp